LATFELAVAYLISSSFKLGDDPAAAGVDRESPAEDLLLSYIGDGEVTEVFNEIRTGHSS
jgi:hypothetical protein